MARTIPDHQGGVIPAPVYKEIVGGKPARDEETTDGGPLAPASPPTLPGNHDKAK